MFLSIITPTLNSEATLGDALVSAQSQTTGDAEHLVIDAVSIDGTLCVAGRFPDVTAISEPDNGIYDGMNKGAYRARGEWLLFLQGDDWLPAGAIAAYRQAAAMYPDADMICGMAEAVRIVAGDWVPVWTVTETAKRELTLANIALGEPMINARLIRKSLFFDLGGFSGDFRLASDRDFLLRAASSGVRQVEIDDMTYRYRWHQGSSTMTDSGRLSSILLGENLEIARRQLDLAKKGERAVLKSWHDRLQVQSAMNALERFDLRDLYRSISGALMVNPVWFLSFATEFFRSLPGFLIRGCRTRSQMNKVVTL